MKKTKYLIIGAGISGLTFAYYAKDNYLIVEKENEIGGYCRTINKSGYIWDYAGHFYHFKTEEFKKMFLENIKKDDIVVQEKCTNIIYKDGKVDYPFQMNIHQLEKQEFIDCLYDLFNKEEKDKYDNFLDMLYGKFGKSIVEKFLKPYNEKLYAIDLKNLDTDAMGRFFPYANKEQIINNMKESKNTSYNNNFMYPKNGAEAFIKVLYNNVDSSKILLNTQIVSIDIDKKIATTNTGEEISYEYLINSSPLPNFLNNLNNKKYKELSSKLSYNKVLVFNLGFSKKSVFNKEHWIYIPEKKYNYYRIGFYDNILNSDKLSMYIEIGYPKDAVITKEEINKQLELTLENLEKQGIIDKDNKLVDYVSIVMDPAYVHIEKKTEKEIETTFKELEEKQIYSLGRYGKWTYCSMEDCLVWAKELGDKIICQK